MESTTSVGELLDAFVDARADRLLRLRADNPEYLYIAPTEPGASPYAALPREATLGDLGVRNGATLTVQYRVWAGGVHPSDLLLFVGEAVASGVVGNAAYDLLRSTLQAVRRRWKHATPTLRRDEAIDLTRAALCLRFGIEDPGLLELTAADPVVVRFSGDTIHSLRPIRFPRLRRSPRDWRCTYRLAKAALPPSADASA